MSDNFSCPVCQSCGMPFDEAHLEYLAREADGSDSIYCAYCYRDGAFLNADATIGDIVEMGVPYLAHKIGKQAAREQLSAFVPTLARWKGQDTVMQSVLKIPDVGLG